MESASTDITRHGIVLCPVRVLAFCILYSVFCGAAPQQPTDSGKGWVKVAVLPTGNHDNR